MNIKKLHILMPFGLIFYLFFFSGCSDVNYTPKQEAKFVKPTIAVIGFENRAPETMQSQIGSGMSEQLTERLIATKRYVVIERQYFNQILQELSNSKSDMFRDQGRLETGKLKNVNYLIRGVITDFGFVETNQGIGRVLDLGLLGPSSYAIVAATVTVVDVQSGQTIASVSVEGRAKTTSQKKDMRDDSVAFGGHAFYKSSLGKATNDMLEEAVREISQVIAERKYRPRIARIDGKMVFISGGKDRMIKPEQVFFVREAPEKIDDPETGDSLGSIPGKFIGRIQIRHVMDRYSVAEIMSGNSYRAGQVLYDPEDDPGYDPNPKPDIQVQMPF